VYRAGWVPEAVGQLVRARGGERAIEKKRGQTGKRSTGSEGGEEL